MPYSVASDAVSVGHRILRVLMRITRLPIVVGGAIPKRVGKHVAVKEVTVPVEAQIHRVVARKQGSHLKPYRA